MFQSCIWGDDNVVEQRNDHDVDISNQNPPTETKYFILIWY